MKHISYAFLCILLIMVVSACSSSNQGKIQSDYLKMLEEPAGEEKISETGLYLDRNLKKFDKENADQMVVAYEDYIYSLNESPDYEELVNRYGKYISDDLMLLYQIKNEEQKNPIIIDSKLQYTWRQLCKKTIDLEIFIKGGGRPKLVREEAADIYVYYIKTMMMGTGGTPIFDYDTGDFQEDAKAAYSELSAAYPDTVVAGLIGEYFDYLESINFKLNYKKTEEKVDFSETCTYLGAEARKRVLQ